jgi:hypothetical protein
MKGICSECGNNHYGPCATEETTFIWEVEGREAPKEVLIKGSWKKWQAVDRLSREVSELGEVFFRISLMLHPGTYQYKYIVDGEWREDPKAPSLLDEYGNCNNVVKVLACRGRCTRRRCSCR